MLQSSFGACETFLLVKLFFSKCLHVRERIKRNDVRNTSNHHGHATKRSLKRNGPLNAKGIKQSQKRNGPLNARAIKQSQKRNGPLNAKTFKQSQKRNAQLKGNGIGRVLNSGGSTIALGGVAATPIDIKCRPYY